jgi:hypothetical protein
MRIYEVTGKTTAYNSTYPKGGVSCSKDSFVGNQTLVFQIKFCGKSPALLVAAFQDQIQIFKLKIYSFPHKAFLC